MNKGLGRLNFTIGIIVITSIVFGFGYLISSNTELRIVDSIVILSTLPIGRLVFLREKNINPNSRWRIWYISVFSLLLVLAISVIIIPSSSNVPVHYEEALASLGYYFFYIILTLPVLMSCAIQKSSGE